MKRTTIALLAVAASLATTPAFADRVGEAAKCLEEAGLVQGTAEEVRVADAHFAVIQRESATGTKVRSIAFHTSVRAGEAPGVDLDKVKDCMEGARGPDWRS